MENQSATAITLRLAKSLEEVRRKGQPHVVDFTVLQLNDVYEAAPVEGGRLGGVARATTLRKQLAKDNPNFFSVMIGDFLSPSPIGATTGDAGEHMVEALNSMGLDYATVGNHEFDVEEADLLERVEQSRFEWIISNVTNGKGELFPGMQKNKILEFSNEAGEKVRVGLIGVCLDMVKKPWIQYQNVIESANEQVAELDGKIDVLIAMTHLTMPEDHELGAKVPRLDVLMGGHEHERAHAVVGDDGTPIFKADSNARSAFVHYFRFNTKTGVTDLFTDLVIIDDKLEADPETAAIVAKWQNITYETLRAQGHEPLEVIGRTTVQLEGYEAAVRNGSTNLTDFIVETFHQEAPDADVVIFQSGFIRIDGIIPVGDIKYFDVVRIFPTGGYLTVANCSGRGILKAIELGEAGKGTGAFQCRTNITQHENGQWLIKGEPIDEDRIYKIIMTGLPTAALSRPPFKGKRFTKLYDTRPIREIITDRFRRDLAKSSA